MAGSTKTKRTKCCDDTGLRSPHPDHRKELHRINRISGQLEGIKRMIAEQEYCPKILMQIHAVKGALKSLEAIVLERHLENCVRDALITEDRKQADEKLAELMELFRRG